MPAQAASPAPPVPAKALDQTEEEESPPKTYSFWINIFRMACPIYGLVDAITVVFLVLITIPLLIPNILFLFLLVLKALIVGYLCSYFFNVVIEVADGSDGLPGPGGIDSYWDDVIRPLLLFVASFLFVWLPALVTAGLMIKAAIDAGESAFDIDFTQSPVLVILFFAGLFFWPMTLLALALGDSVGTLRPDRIILLIWLALGSYLIICLALAALGFVWKGAHSLTLLDPDADAGAKPSLFAHLLLPIVTMWVCLYALRLIGLLYKHRLAWHFG